MKKLITLLVALVASTTIYAQSSKASTAVVVPFGPGGSSDIIARVMVKGLHGSDYHVLNMPGGKGIPAVQHIISNQSMMVATLVQYYVSNPLTVPNIPFNINTDVDFIGAIGVVPNILLCNNKNVPVKTFKDLKNINKPTLNIGISSIGSQEHIVAEIIAKSLPKSITTQIVPYSQGGVSYMPDLISGNIDCIAGLYPAVKSQLSNPNLVALISTHSVDHEVDSWESVFRTPFPYQGISGLLVGKNINSVTRDTMVAQLGVLFKQEGFKQQIKDQGLIPILSTDPATLKDIIKKQQEFLDFLVKSQIRLQ